MEKDKPKKPRKRRRWLLVVLLLFVGILVVAALKTSRLGYESPDYEVVEKNARLELRSYAAMGTVSTPMGDGSGRQGMNGGFGRLFRYITGDNEGGEKVAMTTPVLIDTSSPGDGASMNFVLPSAVAAAGAPTPSGENVSLREFEASDLAAIRFYGFRDETAIDEAESRLRKWIDSKGWTAAGEPMLAYYDPPWTPGFLRRNEVLIRVER